MSQIVNPFVFMIAALSLAGCASTGRPTYSPPTSGQMATIKGGNANVIRFFSDGDSHVAIIEIDGQYIPPSFWTGSARSVKVSPGPRKITVLLSGNNYTQAQDVIQIDAAPGGSYQIEARKVGIAFDVVVYEEAKPPAERKVVLSTRISGGSSGGPAYIPIIVPTR